MEDVYIFKHLIGKTISEIDGDIGDAIMTLVCESGEQFTFYHKQNCCESVYIEDVCGDIEDLLGSPLLEAEEVTYDNEDPPEINIKDEYRESWTWTFYKFATIKGSVTIRWMGSSNGYYSEAVYIKEKYFDDFFNEHDEDRMRYHMKHMTKEQQLRAIYRSKESFNYIQNPSPEFKAIHEAKWIL